MGRALKHRLCTLEGEAQDVNVWGSVQWERVYTGGANFFN